MQRVVLPNARRAVWFAHATGAIERHSPAAQPAVPADRFAREIEGILAGCMVRLRRLNGNPLDGAQPHLIHSLSNPVLYP